MNVLIHLLSLAYRDDASRQFPVLKFVLSFTG